MHATLVVTNGDDAGRRVPVPAGAAVRFGRTPPADAVFSGDSMMSNLHFSVECDDAGATVRDLGSRFGVLVNGSKVTDARLRDGDVVKAGRTEFGVELLGEPAAAAADPMTAAGGPPAAGRPALAEPAPEPAAATNGNAAKPQAEFLRRLPGRLYAVLDAAREPSVVDRMAAAKAEYASLYDGDQGKELEAFGPWLVSLPPGHPLFDELLADGWGQSWGIFLTSDLPLADVRRHLRKFLLAKLPDGRQVYFRYYDPRVLRTYLPTCTPAETQEFFGPVSRMVAEGPDSGELLAFGASHSEWQKIGPANCVT